MAQIKTKKGSAQFNSGTQYELNKLTERVTHGILSIHSKKLCGSTANSDVITSGFAVFCVSQALGRLTRGSWICEEG